MPAEVKSALDVFTQAARTVLSEIEIEDGRLALPITMSPGEGGVRMQVSYEHFDAWCEVLAGCQFVVLEPAYLAKDGTLQEHLQATGTINNHHVAIVTVRHLAEKPAVAS